MIILNSPFNQDANIYNGLGLWAWRLNLGLRGALGVYGGGIFFCFAHCSQQQFNKYYDPPKAKYPHYGPFLGYFGGQWASQIPKTNKWAFYLGGSNVLMTNNICESLNATIKRDFANRERLPLHQFFQTLKDVLNDEKLENRTFKTELQYSTAPKLKAPATASKRIFAPRGGSYYIDSKLQERLEFDPIDRNLDLDYDPIQNFDADPQRPCMLGWDRSKKKAKCHCLGGFLYGVCQYKVALEMFLGSVSRPAPPQPNKKRGRKRKAGGAPQRDEMTQALAE